MSNDNPKTLISAIGTLHWQGFKKEFLSSEALMDDKPGQGKQAKAEVESKINAEIDLKVEPADVDDKQVNGVPSPVEIQNKGETNG